MASVTYYTASGQTAFNVAAPVGLPQWQQPFPEQSSQLVFTQKYWRTAVSYSPVALNTAFDYPGNLSLYVPPASQVSFYLVAESDTTEVRGGVYEWTRTYAQVPSNRYEPIVYPYQFPAILSNASSVFSNYATVNFAAPVGGNKMYIDPIFPVGSRVSLSYRYGASVQFGGAVVALDNAPNGTIIELDPLFIATTYPRAATFFISTTSGLRRQPLNAPGRAVVSYGYFLATAGVPTFAITPQARQRFLLGSEEVPYVSNSTTPTAASYYALVTSYSWFVAEDEQVTRWMGNIMERKVTYVYAQ